MIKVNIFIRRFIFIASACILLCSSSHAMEKGVDDKLYEVFKNNEFNHTYYTLSEPISLDSGSKFYISFKDGFVYQFRVFPNNVCSLCGCDRNRKEINDDEINSILLNKYNKWAILEVKLNDKSIDNRYYPNICSIYVKDDECKGVFSCQEDILSVKVIAYKAEDVINMRSMFEWCYNLTSLDLSNFNTKNVEDMNGMFCGCSSLTSLNLNNFNTGKVKDMGYMFYGCSSLQTVDLSNFNTNKVKNMAWMFRECSKLANLNLSNFNTSNVEDMGYMFYGCSNLQTVDLSNFNTINVENMGQMFEGCGNLISLNLDSFKTDNVNNIECMFKCCSILKNVGLANFNLKAVTNMNDMFTGCIGFLNIICSGAFINDIKEFINENVNKQDVRIGLKDNKSLLTNHDDKDSKTSNVYEDSEIYRIKLDENSCITSIEFSPSISLDVISEKYSEELI